MPRVLQRLLLSWRLMPRCFETKRALSALLLPRPAFRRGTLSPWNDVEGNLLRWYGEQEEGSRVGGPMKASHSQGSRFIFLRISRRRRTWQSVVLEEKSKDGTHKA